MELHSNLSTTLFCHVLSTKGVAAFEVRKIDIQDFMDFVHDKYPAIATIDCYPEPVTELQDYLFLNFLDESEYLQSKYRKLE